jgi:hypothetical protein
MLKKHLLVIFAFIQMVSFAKAQDTIFVSCWTGKNSEVYRARKVTGRVVSSATGEKAYVSVSANASGGACLNITRLFVAGPTGEFHQVFEAKPTKGDDGNGMRLIGWDRSGKKLLAELGRWSYGTDAGMARDLILYDAKTAKISQVNVADGLAQHFGSGYNFLFETTAWHEPEGVVVTVKKYEDLADGEGKSCVQRPTQLIVNLSSGAVNQVSGK